MQRRMDGTGRGMLQGLPGKYSNLVEAERHRLPSARRREDLH